MAGVTEREIDANMIRAFAANARPIEAYTRAHGDPGRPDVGGQPPVEPGRREPVGGAGDV
jgi:hypothetical protein